MSLTSRKRDANLNIAKAAWILTIPTAAGQDGLQMCLSDYCVHSRTCLAAGKYWIVGQFYLISCYVMPGQQSLCAGSWSSWSIFMPISWMQILIKLTRLWDLQPLDWNNVLWLTESGCSCTDCCLATQLIIAVGQSLFSKKFPPQAWALAGEITLASLASFLWLIIAKL